MIESIRNCQTLKPTMFFTDGSLGKKTIEEYNNFNDFIFALSYFSSWSTGFSIWKVDFQKNNTIAYNQMFPHTSLLFNLYDQSSYIVNDMKMFINQTVNKKGGYNLFETFAIKYLEMVEDLLINKHITKKTFEYIKHDLYRNFLIVWYCNTKILKNDYTYNLKDIKKSMQSYYSTTAYYKMILFSYLTALKVLVQKTLKNIKSTF